MKILIVASPCVDGVADRDRGEEFVASVAEAEAIGRWLLGTTLWLGALSDDGTKYDSIDVQVWTETNRKEWDQ
ncbi:hypothetical protein UFOVP1313_55 [uncultured Caudovirales phage]|uniref:Uncharacterized protein n=1 Tax=uncultured Caudovirales phage TaxID=2100421 RepID=A0A6J5RX67_9CAUD|nr:hypothetical protein UFOVP1313_55 [uncultured Caudovirales phage]